jgi:hypothetical protein
MNPNTNNTQNQTNVAPPQQQSAGQYGAYGPQPAVASGSGYTAPQQVGQGQHIQTKSNPNSTQNTGIEGHCTDGLQSANLNFSSHAFREYISGTWPNGGVATRWLLAQ